MDDPLGVHVEAFVEGEEDSRDSVQEVGVLGGRCLFSCSEVADGAEGMGVS